jgi:hypothetical protein
MIIFSQMARIATERTGRQGYKSAPAERFIFVPLSINLKDAKRQKITGMA